jgi:hypothetical protein
MVRNSRSVTWKGTEHEEKEFVAAVEQHCACTPPEEADDICSAHQLLIGDQATLDRLVFFRRIADKLRREEGLPTGDAH